jgi:hypothetical protein
VMTEWNMNGMKKTGRVEREMVHIRILLTPPVPLNSKFRLV